MKIGIIGGGSIGLLMAVYLSEQHEVTIYVRRNKQKEHIDTHGLYIGQAHIQRHIKVDLFTNIQAADCFFICVKQTDLQDVLPFIQKFQMVPTIFLQNGMGHLHMIDKLEQPLFVGVVEHGARRINDNHVEHTGEGVIKIAAYKDKLHGLDRLIVAFDRPHFPIIHMDNWYDLLSKKLIVNAVINPLTALFRVKNRQIVKNTHIRNLAKVLCAETATVLRLNEREEWEHVQNIAHKTGANRSSMLTDIESDRPTEIEAITGYILGLSDAYLPYTSFVYQSIKAVEKQKGLSE